MMVTKATTGKFVARLGTLVAAITGFVFDAGGGVLVFAATAGALAFVAGNITRDGGLVGAA